MRPPPEPASENFLWFSLIHDDSWFEEEINDYTKTAPKGRLARMGE